jgi:hypothetical protein
MPGFITTDDSWCFNLEDLPPVIEVANKPDMATGYLALPGRWENYSDDIIYDIEKKLRKFLKEKEEDPHWKWARTTYRKFTVGMMYEILYGRKWDPTRDGKYAIRMARILGYYSSRIQKEGVIRGKKYTKTIYTLSLSRFHKVPPYSLRLRIEWLADRGELPTTANMQLPKESLQPGHARNPRTEENMARRRELAKERYRGRYKSGKA